MKSCFNYPNIMNPKSIEEVPSWVIVNALKCPVDAQISIVAKLLQHLDGDQRNKALSMSGVVISSPNQLEPVLALITHQGELGLIEWYEVVYYFDKWYSYSGSKTFDDGEQVIRWKYCKDCL
jgi:hypothetical protein